MRRLKLQVQVTVDGFIAGPSGEMDWMIWDWDEELKRFVNGLTEPIDCIVLGRVLAQGFIPTWQSRAEDKDTADAFSHKMVNTQKVVFTKTMQKLSEWKNTVVANGDLVEEIKNLKAQPGSDIIAYGGGTFVSSLIEHNLIDEYHLFINPVAIGGGMPIFTQIKEKLKLKLINATSFPCGIALLSFKPNDDDQEALIKNE